KGTKALPEFDLEVHRRLHLRRTWIADDASRAQRSRPKLHAALKPADDFLVDKKIDDLTHQLGFIARRLVARVRAIEECPNLRAGERWAEKAAVLVIGFRGPPRLFEQLVPHEERGSKRAAGVAGRGLSPDVVEGA